MAKTSIMVQLGAADGLVSSETTCYDSKLGGLPDWPSQIDPGFNNKCPLCDLNRPLVFQCYAPLENSPYYRTLYIFACINSNCWNKSKSWTCIRIQYKNENEVKNDNIVNSKADATSNIWCDDANDWDDDDGMNKDIFSVTNISNAGDEAMDSITNDFQGLNCSNVHSRLHELKAFLSAMPEATAEIESEECSNITIDNPPIPNINVLNVLNQTPDLPIMMKNEPVQFSCMYIKVYTEYLDEIDDDYHVNDLLNKYQQENETDFNFETLNEKSKKKNDAFNNEEYEKSVPLHGNALFHSFLTRIKMNPEQIVRYSLNGQPLLISDKIDGNNPGKCEHCSGRVQFELQLLPKMIPFLKIVQSEQTHLEFGNVIVYTCKNSCWKDDSRYIEETILIQSEPT